MIEILVLAADSHWQWSRVKQEQRNKWASCPLGKRSVYKRIGFTVVYITLEWKDVPISLSIEFTPPQPKNKSLSHWCYFSQLDSLSIVYKLYLFILVPTKYFFIAADKILALDNTCVKSLFLLVNTSEFDLFSILFIVADTCTYNLEKPYFSS